MTKSMAKKSAAAEEKTPIEDVGKEAIYLAERVAELEEELSALKIELRAHAEKHQASILMTDSGPIKFVFSEPVMKLRKEAQLDITRETVSRLAFSSLYEEEKRWVLREQKAAHVKRLLDVVSKKEQVLLLRDLVEETPTTKIFFPKG